MFDVHPPARYVACGDGVGAAEPRRPTGVKLGAGRSKDGLDQDDPATIEEAASSSTLDLRL